MAKFLNIFFCKILYKFAYKLKEFLPNDWLLTSYSCTIMIKIQNLIRQIIFFSCIYLVNGLTTLSQTVQGDEFLTKLSAVKNPQLVDVRTPGEFGGGHLIGATNINVKEPDFNQQIEKLDKTKPVFVYCLSGGRSKTAKEIFEKSGFQVVELAGGYLKWSSENKPVESVPNAPMNNNGRFTKDEISKLINENNLVLLDYFAEWCGPCKKMDPFIQKLKKEYDGKVKILKIDTDKNKTLAINNLVSELPTVVFYKNGKEFWRSTGEQDEVFLRELFDLNIGK